MVVVVFLLGLAFLALLVAADTTFTQYLPLGFEGGLAFGSIAFWFGILLCIIAFVFSFVARSSFTSQRTWAAVVGAVLVLLSGFGLLLIKS